MPILGHKIETTTDNFGYLVQNNCLLVDKTLMIKEFMQEQNVFLILRPRRSGKSITISMLQHFFSPQVAGESTQGLFDNFLIAKEDGGEFLKQYQGKYPVISISFKDIKTKTYKEAIEQIESLIQKLYREHEALLTAALPKAVTENDKAVFTAYLTGNMREKLQSSLRFLSDFLFKAYGRKTIILIDEYDSPLTSAYQEGFDGEFLNRLSLFLRDMFSEALKTTTSLEKGFMTGILRISKNDLLSGLNNLQEYTLLSKKYAQYFGFIESEVMELLQYVQPSDSLEAIRAFYNGYLMGDTIIYNPWSFMKYLHEQELAPYWVLSSGDGLLKQLFLHSDEFTKEQLSLLMQSQTITGVISLKLRYEDLKMNYNALWTLLLFTGYLTVVSKTIQDDGYQCQLKIPNQEVFAQYRGIFKNWLENTVGGHPYYDTFLKSLLLGNGVK